MDSEKIFWGLTAFIVLGFFAFLAVSAAVQPVNAAQQQGDAGQQQFAAPSNQAAPAAQPGGAQLAAQPGGTLAPTNSGVQEVTLSVQGGSYLPNPIRVKKGVPVRLVADIANMPGCSKSIVIPEFGIRKTVSYGGNTIEFTPAQSGTFKFSCSMNMYRGTIIVEEADGSVANFQGSAPQVKAGSCGGSGGGCGCGG